MPILSQSNRRATSQRLAIGVIYSVLSVLGLTMVVPFLITLTLSVSDAYDYQRYCVIPRYFYSASDRYVKYLTDYFYNFSDGDGQMLAYYPGVPPAWANRVNIGRSDDEVGQLAAPGLLAASARNTGIMARDYADFCETFPVENSVATIDDIDVENFLREKYEGAWAQQNPAVAATASSTQKRTGALQLLRKTWGIPFSDFSQVNFRRETLAPRWQQSWFPDNSPKYTSFLDFEKADRDLRFMPGIRAKWSAFLREKGAADAPLAPNSPGQLHSWWLEFKERVAPAGPVMPYASRSGWRKYLQSDSVREALHLSPAEVFDIAAYNRLAGTQYWSWFETPYPLPVSAPQTLQQLWSDYVQNYFPLRLMTLKLTPGLNQQYQTFLQTRFNTVAAANQVLGTSAAQWSGFLLPSDPPSGAQESALRGVWADFVKTLPPASKQLHSSEAAFQEFILQRYGSLDSLNRAWGTHYVLAEEVFPPFAQAYEITYRENAGSFVLHSIVANYAAASYYLFQHADAVPVTLVLIVLSILVSLTINPMAAYALSRFQMAGQDKIILFLLATSAFPAMISAIPGFLLMRDLGMLNTFFALVLPGAASGMAIFILKGFFDSLPPELAEAAMIDGAREWQIFFHVVLPMVKPILAVNALTAFLAAYEGWQWALLVCQNPKMWTLSVWMFEVSQRWVWIPWVTSAGYVLISIPTLIVFLSCQRIILRGIVIPQMK